MITNIIYQPFTISGVKYAVILGDGKYPNCVFIRENERPPDKRNSAYERLVKECFFTQFHKDNESIVVLEFGQDVWNYSQDITKIFRDAGFDV